MSVPEYDPAPYGTAHRHAPDPSWPVQEQRRATGRRTFSARVTAAIAAGAFLVGAVAAILVGGLTGPVGGPGGGPGGTPPGISGTQDGGTGTGTAPSTGT